MGSQQLVAGRSNYRVWSIAAVALLAVVVAEALVYRETWSALIETWVTIDTYNYGFVVLVLSAALLFRSRHKWLPLSPVPSLWGVVATAGVSLVWWFGSLTGIQTLQHLAVLAFVPSAALALFGTRVMSVVIFPFVYLLLATPFGEFMVPALISYTADFSVYALEVIGVPVFRDGPYIRIPAGDFHVVKACSGIRYLLTSVVLGALYAHFGFRSWTRRAAFMALCVVTPIVANWVRATLIILIGHLSNMKLAAGVDHFIYGWLFFGLVMGIIFLIGSRFSDGGPVEATYPELDDVGKPRALHAVVVIAGMFLAAGVGNWIIGTSSQDPGDSVRYSAQAPGLPQAAPGWLRQDQLLSDWKPVYIGSRSLVTAGYTNESLRVSAIVVYYDTQSQGAELVNVRNSLYDPENWWLRFDKSHLLSEASGYPGIVVREVSVNDGSRNRLFWSWYSISGNVYSNEISAKLAAVRAAIGSGPVDSRLIALSADYGDDIGTARTAMLEFLASHADATWSCNGDSACE